MMLNRRDFPSDWQFQKLTSIVENTRLGGNYTNSEEFTGLPLIKMGNLGRGIIQLDKIEYINKNETVNDQDILSYGDVLFNTRNTLDLVGKVAIWRDELDKAVYNSNVLRITFKQKYIHSNEYANLLFNSYFGLRQLRRIAIGTTSVAAIYWRDLKNILFPLPPPPEQKIIIAILTTWDAAIGQIQKLIDAKIRLKKGLMQQLLTGKRRFPEFIISDKIRQTKYGSVPMDWNYIRIKEFAKEVKAHHDNHRNIPVLSCTKYDGLVDSLKYFGKRIFSEDTSNYKLVIQNQFAYATNHIEEGSIGLMENIPMGLVSPMYTVFKTDNTVNPSYLFKVFKTEKYRHIFAISTNASVNRRGSLRWKQFSELKVAIPSIEEQDKINYTLNELNHTIDLLNIQLEQIKRQKAGLMQVLLTGKVRVKVGT